MKKFTTKKRKINSKKGFSMVLAIALVAVLFLTTTSFLSIAMLQQKETGTSNEFSSGICFLKKCS